MKFQGRITYYIPNRHFGFIRGTDGKELFFHVSNYIGVPALSTNVEFEIGPPIKEGKAPQAINITPIDNTDSVDDIVSLLSGGVQ
jgi:cold shock CspA family protein